MVVPYPLTHSLHPIFIGFRVEEPHPGGRNPVGEKEHEPFQFTFNGFLKVDFQESRVTSDAALVRSKGTA